MKSYGKLGKFNCCFSALFRIPLSYSYVHMPKCLGDMNFYIKLYEILTKILNSFFPFCSFLYEEGKGILRRDDYDMIQFDENLPALTEKSLG